MTESLPTDARVAGVHDVVLVFAVAQACADDLVGAKLDADEVAYKRQRNTNQTVLQRV